MAGKSGAVRNTEESRPIEAKRFATFLITGGVAAVCNVTARSLMSRVMGYELAVTIAYLLGMLVAFVLAKIFVFTPGGRRWHAELTRFAAVNAVSFAQVWIVSVGLEKFLLPRMHWSWHPELCAHLAGVASPVIISYFAHKHFTFSTQESETER